MKFKRLTQLLVFGTIALGVGTPVSALTGVTPQELAEKPSNITINSPSNDATVGYSVTLTGTARADRALGVAIDGNSYVDPRDRGVSEARDAYTPAVSDGAGHFSITLDLSGSGVTVDSAGQFHAISPGTHQFVVYEMYAQDGGKSQTITLTVGSGNTEASAATVSATPKSTPTPSPSASALPAKTEGASSQIVPILVAALLGGLVGYGAFRFFPRSK